MKFLLKFYKRFLIGLILIIIGLTLSFASVIYLLPSRNHVEYFPLLLTTFKYVMIIFPSLIILVIGMGAWTEDRDVMELFRNFNKAFGKNKQR